MACREGDGRVEKPESRSRQEGERLDPVRAAAGAEMSLE